MTTFIQPHYDDAISGGEVLDVFEAGSQQAIPSSVKLRHKGGIVLPVTNIVSIIVTCITGFFTFLKFIIGGSFCVLTQVPRIQDPVNNTVCELRPGIPGS